VVAYSIALLNDDFTSSNGNGTAIHKHTHTHTQTCVLENVVCDRNVDVIVTNI